MEGQGNPGGSGEGDRWRLEAKAESLGRLGPLFQLQPALTLDTGVELRRDSEVTGRNQTDAKLNLRYVF